MSFIAGFGSYLPSKIVNDADLAEILGCSADWIRSAAGIEERRFASAEESVESMGAAAGQSCLAHAGLDAGDVGMLIVSSGSGERRFPGAACMVAQRLGLGDVPAIDLPVASAGSLFGMAMAAQLAERYGNILVIATEKMSTVVAQAPVDKNIAILFGDGAGSCLIRRDNGMLKIVDFTLHSDGSFADDLQLGCGRPLEMNGRSVILHATRKIPAVINEVLERNGRPAADVDCFLMHQANQNLMDRVARALKVAEAKIYSNIRVYGNTSSASMLIAADEWWRGRDAAQRVGAVCFATFGAGFHWGALLCDGA